MSAHAEAEEERTGVLGEGHSGVVYERAFPAGVLRGSGDLVFEFLILAAARRHWFFLNLFGYTVLQTDPEDTSGQMFRTPKGGLVSVACLEKYLSHLAKKLDIKKPVTFKSLSNSPWRKGFALQVFGGRENVSKATRVLKGRRRGLKPFCGQKAIGEK